jgi:surfeit locus 1 family protein
MKKLLTPGWLLTTLLALAGMAVLIRLGFWQLERLAQRRAFNARVLAQTAAPPFTLTAGTLAADLTGMEYRKITVTGEYLPAGEVALRNQALYGQPGYHLLTPLVITGVQTAVLVDRGFVPADQYTPGSPDKFAEPGVQTVTGVIRLSQTEPDFGARADPTPLPGGRLEAWFLVNIAQIARQTSLPLLDVYIQQQDEVQGDAALPASDPFAGMSHPIRTQPPLELGEGPHLGYAIQWFAFAAILGIGYPLFIHRELQKDATP